MVETRIVIMSAPGLNRWAERTLRYARSEGYLDALIEIYRVELHPPRHLPDDVKENIRRLYGEGEYHQLINLLLGLRDFPFPVEHPYASLLRSLGEGERDEVMRRNPKLVKSLSEMLRSMGSDSIIGGMERPKDINRGLGSAFKSWIKREFNTEPFRLVERGADLLGCGGDHICIYVGSDVTIAKFARQQLHLEEPEEEFYNRDIIARVGNTYIIGEARFLSTPGGSQNRDVRNTLGFVERMEEIGRSARGRGVEVRGIALMDGIIWLHNSYMNLIRSSATGDRVVMSALFLKEYLSDLHKSPQVRGDLTTGGVD
jgi:hypothetical protein